MRIQSVRFGESEAEVRGLKWGVKVRFFAAGAIWVFVRLLFLYFALRGFVHGLRSNILINSAQYDKSGFAPCGAGYKKRKKHAPYARKIAETRRELTLEK
ncbi:MAG: hypothetical protein ABMA02_02815 [Saprospiraceae bacterium]